MKIGLSVCGALLAALLIAPVPGFAQDSDDTSSDTTPWVIIEHISPEQQTTIDLGAEGESQGDMFVFTGSILDTEGEETGTSSGFCVTTSVEEKLSECVWTYHFADGTITVAGTEADLGVDTATQMPIVGGTGGYAGARGVIHEEHNEELTVYTTTIELIDSPLISESAAITESIVDYWNSVMVWADIDEADQAAWTVLGWDETNWDNADPTTIPVSETTPWDELTEEEQEAAASLGYAEADWAELQARMPEADADEFWSSLSWDDLKYSEMRLWGILGWDAESWEGTTDAPESDTKPWDELTEEEQEAATQLGYTDETWVVVEP